MYVYRISIDTSHIHKSVYSIDMSEEKEGQVVIFKIVPFIVALTLSLYIYYYIDRDRMWEEGALTLSIY